MEQQVRVVPANNRQRDGEASILSPEEQNRSRHRSAHRGGLKLSTTHLAPYYTPPFRLRQDANSLSAPSKLLIRCGRVGGHRGLRLRWLWLELGSGKLRVREARLERAAQARRYTFENHNNIHIGP